MEVAGKVIIVTGAASGIGRGLCQRFAKEGAKAIIAADVNEAGAKAVADEVKGEAVVCDVRKEADIIRLVKFTEDKYGGVDLFCSNAGIIAIGGYEVDNESWQRIWEINVLAHVFAARAVIPGMIKRGGGAFHDYGLGGGAFKSDRFPALFRHQARGGGPGGKSFHYVWRSGYPGLCPCVRRPWIRK